MMMKEERKMTDDLLMRLRAKQLPQISGYNGDYVNEDYVLETFSDAADRIEKLEAELAALKMKGTNQ
jgi:hypothetical protein